MVAWTHPPRRCRDRQSALARPLRVVEEPREPHHPAAGQVGLDRQDRPHAAPGLPTQRGPPAGLAADANRGSATKDRCEASWSPVIRKEPGLLLGSASSAP